MLTTLSVILGLAVAYLIATAAALLSGGKIWLATTETTTYVDGEPVTTKTRNQIATWQLIAAIAIGAVVGTINALAKSVPLGWTIAFAAVLLAVLAALTVWYFREAGNWREFAVFFGIFLLMGFPIAAVTVKLPGIWQVLTLVASGTMLWLLLIRMLFRRATINQHRDLVGRAKAQRIIAWILAVLLVLGDVASIWAFVATNKQPVVEEPKQETPAPAPAPAPRKTVFWYQLNALDQATEPGNFGPAPEFDWGNTTGRDVWDEFKSVVCGDDTRKPDPNIGVSFAYYLDNVTGKRLLAYSDPDDTQSIINEISYLIGEIPGAEKNREDSAAYDVLMSQTIKSVEQYAPTFEVYTTKELKAKGITVKDQLYADYCGMQVDDNGLPVDIKLPVVWECEMAPDDHFLFIDFYIKGREVQLVLHVECLFQPCNPSQYMKVVVKQNPVNPVKPAPTDNAGGKPKPSTDNAGGKPQQTTETAGGPPITQPVTNPKDVTRGTDVGKNDDPGPGEDTNTGVGSTVGAKDTNPTNTINSGATVAQIESKYQMLEDINNGLQLPGGAPNIPLASRPDVKYVDQTDDTKMYTPPQAPAITGGRTIENSTEQTANGAWQPSADIANGANISVSEVGLSAEQRRREAQQAQQAQSQQTQQSTQTATRSSYGGLDYGANG